MTLDRVGCVVSFTPWLLCTSEKSLQWPLKRRLIGYQSQSWQLGEQKTVMPLPGIDSQFQCNPGHNLDKILNSILQLHEVLIKTTAISFVILWHFVCEFILIYQSFVCILRITIYSFSYPGHFLCFRYLVMLSVIKTIKIAVVFVER